MGMGAVQSLTLTPVIIGKLVLIHLARGFEDSRIALRELNDSLSTLRKVVDSRRAWQEFSVYLCNWPGFAKPPILAWQGFTNHRFFLDVMPDDLALDVRTFYDSLKPIVDSIIERLEMGEDISKKSEPPIALKDLKGVTVEYNGISCNAFLETTEVGHRIYFDIEKIV